MLRLASQSPRRAELLKQLQVPFSTVMVDVDESWIPGESPTNYVARLAELKARTGWSSCVADEIVLGSDTIVVIENEILGKPGDRADSQRMLNLLSGATHQVMTAVAVVTESTIKRCLVTTEVTFKTLRESEINWYWDTGEPRDKAGSYGIQGLGGQFVKHISGSYSAVVGLPLYETSELLQDMGLDQYER